METAVQHGGPQRQRNSALRPLKDRRACRTATLTSCDLIAFCATERLGQGTSRHDSPSAQERMSSTTAAHLPLTDEASGVRRATSSERRSGAPVRHNSSVASHKYPSIVLRRTANAALHNDCATRTVQDSSNDAAHNTVVSSLCQFADCAALSEGISI